MLLQITEPGDALTPEPGRFPAAIGIDLGTTNSLVAHAYNRQATILTGENGESLLPSVVAYCEGKLPLIGKEAFELIDTIPDQIVTSSKRFMGRSWKEAEEIAKTFALNLETASSSRSFIQLKIGSIVKTPVEISADILRALKERAEKALNQPVEKAVITVPAYFDDAARQATKDAAALAGLSVMRLINEPTAAAYAYGLDQGIEGIYAVYDFGGGMSDFSLLRLTGGVFQVLGTGGDTLLGGDDIDWLVADYFQNLSPGHMPLSKSYRQDLKVARYAKEYLSTHEEGTFEWLPNKEYSLGRSTLEPLIAPLIKRTIDICTQVLTEADLTPDEINGVVMVGGATRIPFIQKQVAEFFGKTPLTNLNPDEVVALGAALQAEALTGTFNTLLLDVTPLSLGLETMGGLVEKIIPRNTPIPARVTQEFTTHQTGQTHMKVHVLQGERELVNDCRSLAEFTLAGIPPLSAGTARIAITFEIDADGLLTVNAVEKTTGIHQEIVVKPSYGMTEEDYRKILL